MTAVEVLAAVAVVLALVALIGAIALLWDTVRRDPS